ncbi:MAG: CpsB/CapC family capsule biosynthesis tyrosine phosphatase [Anaerocolumna aminovalerica]|uniref:CpsB/CapC family capsule biosynthesis tyrosine phosphatase n=2 Tax=Anaerocolumna aminovalerica TaxID=1527 RepID=UPI002911C6BD|nr:CpsB/CapC family capsule biosynthesis tyrosine phosphatase [Anaerocolumna aminovalerica]MDU6264249.1 CpsB/CapC family capsule biosynthesis tyrosine phosphatase [Anaerocolumna aminovalerica]
MGFLLIRKRNQNIITTITIIIMIDLHTHILPGIDDGARSITEAVEMTKSLLDQNINKAVCTPHFNPMQVSLQEFINKRTAAMSLMNEAKVALISGSETMLHTYLFHYPDLSELCIGNTKYLLIELPYSKKKDGIYETIEKLISFYNTIPVIAHIERYDLAYRNIKKLREMGCVIQLNTTSLIEKKRRNQAVRYLKDGLIDVLGSDCHNMSNRPPVITQALDIITQEIGNNCCSNLKYKGECIVNGIEINKKPMFLIK